MFQPEDLFRHFAQYEVVQAIVLGGSRATNMYDAKSDYDVYVYSTQSIPAPERTAMLSEFCDSMEIGNHYWECEDNCTLKNGTCLDIIYRDMEAFEREIIDVVINCHSRNGYTTCLWHNLQHTKILYDNSGSYAAMQQRYRIPYPEALRQEIITNNRKLLSGTLPSYEMQIAKAISRGDFVSINHRVTEFLASYFDILFAFNRMTHCGEKRLQAICNSQCSVLPKDFDRNLSALFAEMFCGDIMPRLQSIVDELDKMLTPVRPLQATEGNAKP